MAVKVLGIDPGLWTGYAVLAAPQHLLTHGVVHLANRPCGDMIGTLLGLIQDHVTRFKPDAIAYEDVKWHGAIHAAQVYGGLKYAILYGAFHHFLPVIPVNVQTAKAVIAKGLASKAKVVDSVNRKWGLSLNSKDKRNQDTADAIAIAYAAIQRTGEFVK